MLDNSTISESEIAVNRFRQTMSNIKSPYIQKINVMKKQFHQKVEKFKDDIRVDNQQELSGQQEQKQQVVRHYRDSQLDTEENMVEKQNLQLNRNQEVLSPFTNHMKNKKFELPSQFMKQWTASHNFAFSTIQQAKESFINVFHKKLSVKKINKKEKNYDFKQDQKQMLLNIFHQLQSSYDKGFASIEKILEFFRKNELFYLFYNLHPNRLKYVLKEFARTKPDSLSQKEFLLIFYLERPLIKDLSDPYEKVVNRRCILDAEGWQQMKNIFDTLDTFGNETIHIYPFFKKLKAYHSNPSLIYTPVIQFPEIDRIYTLKKVVFDLEHKFKFGQKMKWDEIQNLIKNFNHKQEPTLDVIFQKHLQKGSIFLDSNYFLIDKKVIELLKNIFERCPKFSEYFVNTKFICQQILENTEIKHFFKNFVRQKGDINGGYINLQQATRFMVAKAPQYIDLDQFLEYFSIKGPITNILLSKNDEITSTDEEKQDHQESVKILKKVRSLQKIQKSKREKKTKKPPKQFTDVLQFNLTKKQKQTIRQKRVKQMIKEKQQAELKELKKKFRANPIPADLNPQRLKEQQKRNEIRKRKKLQQIAKRRQQEKQILGYLKANTRLFEPLNKQSTQERKQANQLALKGQPKSFTHKPVPWYVQQNLLQRIENEKQERKKKLFQEAKVKYVRSWNHLPDFFFKDQDHQNSAEDSLIKNLKKTDDQKSKVVIKANPVPDFKALQKQFEEKLSSKKKSFNPTKIQQFKLTSPDALRKTHCNFLSPQTKVSHKSDWRKTFNSPPQNKITTTKKTEDWMNFNRRTEEQKRFQIQEQKMKKKERLMKQKNFAKFMSQKLKDQSRYMPDLNAQTAQKLRKHKQTVQYLQKLTQKQLSEIYARVLQRPFLFETGKDQQVMQKSYKGKKKVSKKSKKRVVKNIEPIDVSQQSTNKYHQQSGQKVNYGNQLNNHDQQHYLEENNQHYDSNDESQRQHHGLNQSF